MAWRIVSILIMVIAWILAMQELGWSWDAWVAVLTWGSTLLVLDDLTDRRR